MEANVYELHECTRPITAATTSAGRRTKTTEEKYEHRATVTEHAHARTIQLRHVPVFYERINPTRLSCDDEFRRVHGVNGVQIVDAECAADVVPVLGGAS